MTGQGSPELAPHVGRPPPGGNSNKRWTPDRALCASCRPNSPSELRPVRHPPREKVPQAMQKRTPSRALLFGMDLSLSAPERDLCERSMPMGAQELAI